MDTKICRTCLSNTGTISIFMKQDDNMQLSDIIIQYTHLNIFQEDGLPQMICSICESELIISHNYLSKCITSDTRLREIATSLLGPNECELEVKEEIQSDSAYDGNHSDFNDTEEFKEDIKIKVKKDKHKLKKKTILEKNAAKKLFVCNKCGLRVNSKATLEIHERIHTGEKPYECPYCNRLFTREDNRTRHLLQHTRGRKKLVRQKTCKSRQEPCPLCGVTRKSASAMVIHMRSHTGEKPFSCNSCDKSYQSKGSLQKHYECNHLDECERLRRFICETCGKAFFGKRDIATHMRIHTGEKPHACPYCKKRFGQLGSLIRHKRTHTGDKPYSCKICNKSFADKSSLKVHSHVHSEVRNVQCHLCEKMFKTSSSLTSHLRLHNNSKDHICSHCGMAFSTKGNLTLHTKRIHSEKSGECEICLKMVSNLEVHMMKHTGEKPEVCNICNKGFGKKLSLTNHIKFKHYEGKYICTIGDCDKRFPIPSMLEFHLLKHHTNSTPHMCDHCSKGFYRVCDLSKHLKVYHPEIEREECLVKSPVD